MAAGQAPYTAYSTAALVLVVPNLKTSQNFLLDTFFPRTVESDTEYVAIDVDIGKRRIAPFCSPLVEGKMVEQRRYQTNVFKPAYIKDKRAPDLRRPVMRMIGERIGGEFTGATREEANLAAEMTDQIDMLNRRLEWMAAQVIQTGTVTIAGEGFATTVIDFGRDPSLTVALTGTAKWTPANVNAGTATPVLNVEAWQRQMLKKSGATADRIIFTTSAWTGWIADPLLKGAIYYPKLGEAGASVNIGNQIEKGAVYKGRWGQYDLYVYNDWYVDMGTEGGTTDTEYPMLTDGMVIIGGPQMMGVRAFGMILDPAFNYSSLAYAPKMWIAEDPPQRYLMMQSAPITIPSRVNACFAAKVCDPVYT